MPHDHESADSVPARVREVRHTVESWIESATDPISIAAGWIVNPVSSLLRVTVGLPVGIQTHHCMGLHIETYFVPTPAGPVPVPGPTLFVGYVLPDVIGIAIDLAMWATGNSPAPVTGEYVGLFKALRAGDGASGLHVPLLPPPAVLLPSAMLSGSVDLVMGSDSVDIHGRHAVRFLEMGFGCNEPAPGVKVELPNSYMVNPIQYTFPVLAGGNSVIDAGALLDLLLKRLIGELMKAVFAAIGGPNGAIARFVRDFLENFAANLYRDALDGSVDLESVIKDALKALQKTLTKRARRALDPQSPTASVDPRSARGAGGGEVALA